MMTCGSLDFCLEKMEDNESVANSSIALVLLTCGGGGSDAKKLIIAKLFRGPLSDRKNRT